MTAARFELGDLESATAELAESLSSDDAVARLWAQDYTLFADDPTEISNRMGWTDIAQWTLEHWPSIREFGLDVANDVTHVVIMGMGGSSLFPEVLAQSFGSIEGFPELVVIDSTHPDVLAEVMDRCPAESTFHIASSKSGSTIETRSQLETFWERSRDGSRFAVITDPDSELEALATERGFREVFLNDPDIGGRFAALSLFGIVPAAMAGIDGEAILTSALDMADALAPLGDDAEMNIGVHLGAAIAAAEKGGRDKLTFILDPRIESFGLWLEQLIAESLGKAGHGVVPIVGEATQLRSIDSDSRLTVVIGDPSDAGAVGGGPSISLTLEEVSDLGGQVLLWEFAVCFAGVLMGINPFDQPDVESAKVAAKERLAAGPAEGSDPTPLGEALATVKERDHILIAAFVNPTEELLSKLEGARRSISAATGSVTTLSIGPRFLHSSGQLHKGGPDNLVVLQVSDEITDDLQIAGSPHTFGELIAAQAAGDLVALTTAGKRNFRVDIEELLASQ